MSANNVLIGANGDTRILLLSREPGLYRAETARILGLVCGDIGARLPRTDWRRDGLRTVAAGARASA